MTMLERAISEGIDPSLLVGWVEVENGLCKLLSTGGLFTIAPELAWEPGMEKFKVVYNGVIDRYGNLEDCIWYANRVANSIVGWAPAPIGFSRGEWCFDMTTAPDDWHLRGLWVTSKETGCKWFEFYGGYVDDEGDFIGTDGDVVGWEPEDFECWAHMPAPPTARPDFD